MTKKIKNHKSYNGLKTFFLYTFLVGFLIFFSLGIKAILVLKQSKFDGSSLNLAISKNNKTLGIFGFNSETKSVVFLRIKKSEFSNNSVGKELGIIPDANLNSDYDFSNENISSLLVKAMLRSNSIDTDLTIFDIGRLLVLSKNGVDKNIEIKEIDMSSKYHDINKIIVNLFKNDKIVEENISIEIINSTDVSGLGNRLERALSNIGAQVISVSNLREKKKISVMQFYGPKSYTVSKLKDMLNISVEKLSKKQVADITIIIGEDLKDTTEF